MCANKVYACLLWEEIGASLENSCYKNLGGESPVECRDQLWDTCKVHDGLLWEGSYSPPE